MNILWNKSGQHFTKTAAMKNRLIEELTQEFKRTLNPASKFIAEDIANFKRIAASKTEKELREQLNRMQYMNGGKFDRDCKKIVSKLDRGGMYEIKNMNPLNALS
jgi:uncharacterized heparinase superfamily protein